MIRSILVLLVLVTVAQAEGLHRWAAGAEGFNTQSWWYDTGREVVVFDAQFTPDLARTLVADIQRQTASPIRWLVITHPNPDKFNGAPVFQALGAKVVASQRTADALPGVHAYKKAFFVGAGMFTDATYPALATVDVTFEDQLALPLAAGRVELARLPGSGVSSTQTVAYLAAERALVVGDLIHHGVHAWLEGGIVDGRPRPDLDAWKRTLADLAARYAGATVYDGRGTPAPIAAAAAEQVRYLDAARDVVRGYLVELGPRVSELSGPQAGAHHKELARRLAEVFPGYQFSYLVEYGVYGLAGALAAR